jgi:hypothetical protein
MKNSITTPLFTDITRKNRKNDSKPFVCFLEKNGLKTDLDFTGLPTTGAQLKAVVAPHVTASLFPNEPQLRLTREEVDLPPIKIFLNDEDPKILILSFDEDQSRISISNPDLILRILRAGEAPLTVIAHVFGEKILSSTALHIQNIFIRLLEKSNFVNALREFLDQGVQDMQGSPMSDFRKRLVNKPLVKNRIDVELKMPEKTTLIIPLVLNYDQTHVVVINIVDKKKMEHKIDLVSHENHYSVSVNRTMDSIQSILVNFDESKNHTEITIH